MENSDFKTAEVFRFDNSVEYSKGAIVSKTLVRKNTGTITLFSFDSGQSLSEHTAPFDALIQIMDGNAEIIIDKKTYQLKVGESIIMPANIPHAVNAHVRFKMLLTMIKSV
jgi:quercetin dioxygenase-like cupin family protein